MNSTRWRQGSHPRTIAGLAAVLLAWAVAGCRTPKYVSYASPAKDFSCEVPWGWTIVVDPAGSDYANVTFVGPFEPDFYRATPSLSVRWHAHNAPHRLPDGTYESYASHEDYVRQMLLDVYGPEAYTRAGSDRDQAAAAAKGVTLPESSRIKVSGVEGFYFVVYHTIPAPAGQIYGVVRSDTGERKIRQRHAYVILPMTNGFYVLVYPATRDGFEKHKPAFFHLVNTFRALKAGPAGAVVPQAPKT